MDKDTLGVALLAAGAICATVAGLIRYGLLPYLREQLALARETHQQVASAPSSAAEPNTLREDVTNLAGEIEDATLELRAMALMFDGHLEWSQEQVDALWTELKRQRAAGEDRPHRPRHRGDKET